MKRFLLSLVTALFVSLFMGNAFAAVLDVSPLACAGVLLGAGFAGLPNGVVLEGVFTEVWTGEMIKKLRAVLESLGWMNRIPSYDQYAENDKIHMVDVGADPDVLINNTTYPIDIQDLEDGDKSFSLDKYQTKATRIKDDDLHACSYDKMGSHIERHQEAIAEKKFSKAIHALAPTENKTKTPVILTTGTANGTRKAITRSNIIALKTQFDNQKIPLDGRILVLCSEHVNDLLEQDQKFAEQYYNYATGKISRLYGFEVYEYADCPYFNVTTKKKVAFGTAPAADTDRQASVAFYAPRMFKATGTTKFYHSDAATSPTTQENLVNYRHYFVVLPKKEECIGAIVSDKNTEAGA